MNENGSAAVCPLAHDGLPTGIQFTGRIWSEARLLSIAHAYQQATDWHRRRPNLK
jgi:aspartyl-tRNA(Asn)/glutamyl-tRNA(Gln) amidotransferase subunit A